MISGNATKFFREYQKRWYLVAYALAIVFYLFSLINFDPKPYVPGGWFSTFLSYGLSGPGCTDLRSLGANVLFYVCSFLCAAGTSGFLIYDILVILKAPVQPVSSFCPVENITSTNINTSNNVNNTATDNIGDRISHINVLDEDNDRQPQKDDEKDAFVNVTLYSSEVNVGEIEKSADPISPSIRRHFIADAVFLCLAAFLFLLCTFIPAGTSTAASKTSAYFGCIIGVVLTAHNLTYSSMYYKKAILNVKQHPMVKKYNTQALKTIIMFRVNLCALAAVISLYLIAIVARLEVGRFEEFSVCKSMLICPYVPGASLVYVSFVTALIIIASTVLTHSLVEPIFIF